MFVLMYLFTVQVRILHTDYTNALIATCSRLTSDGFCQESHLSVILYTRGVMPSDIMEHDIKFKALMACLDVNSRIIIHDDNCTLRNIRCDPLDATEQEDFKLNRVIICRVICKH